MRHARAALLAPALLVALAATTPATRASDSDAEPASKAAAQRKENTQADREAEFAASLTGAKLVGYWQVTTEGGLQGDGALSEPEPESYEIQSAAKLGGDQWIISARIKFADRDATIPVPVRVIWAEDVAIITLDSMPLPILGTYSARVMFHQGFYSGVWYSVPKNYGGVLSGRILKKSQGEDNTTAPEGHGDHE